MTYKIDKGIPVPSFNAKAKRSWIWDMEIGDSVFFPGKSNPSGRFQYAAKVGWKFTQRAVTENGVNGIRVWRIA